jgi:hypothetical protein
MLLATDIWSKGIKNIKLLLLSLSAFLRRKVVDAEYFKLIIFTGMLACKQGYTWSEIIVLIIIYFFGKISSILDLLSLIWKIYQVMN